MYVEIRSAEHATVQDPGNLRELAVRTACPTHETTTALSASGLGTFDGEHAWLTVHLLRQAGQGQEAQWGERFSQMVSFARDHGWLSEDGSSVRAHLEPVS